MVAWLDCFCWKLAQNGFEQEEESSCRDHSKSHPANMKILGVLFLGLLAMSEVKADHEDAGSDKKQSSEPKAVIMEDIEIIDFMKKQGWNVDALTKVEIGGMIAFQRAGQYVGYCVAESELRQMPPEKIELSGITRIVFGDQFNNPKKPAFVITDPEELKLWVAACSRHTRRQHYSIRFVSLSEDSGFKDASIEVPFSIAHSPSLGLYFYRGDTEVFYCSAQSLGRQSRDENLSPNPSLNPVLESMISARLSK
jgi:hypothetical protein